MAVNCIKIPKSHLVLQVLKSCRSRPQSALAQSSSFHTHSPTANMLLRTCILATILVATASAGIVHSWNTTSTAVRVSGLSDRAAIASALPPNATVPNDTKEKTLCADSTCPPTNRLALRAEPETVSSDAPAPPLKKRVEVPAPIIPLMLIVGACLAALGRCVMGVIQRHRANGGIPPWASNAQRRPQRGDVEFGAGDEDGIPLENLGGRRREFEDYEDDY